MNAYRRQFNTVIYHGACRDGFGAAWAASRASPKAEFIAGYYGQSPPSVTGQHVLMVDFSYPRQAILEMYGQAASLLILDHHKTAQADLQDLPFAVFDMERSGAGMAWDYLNPGEPRPWLIDYIEDRDLWRHALPGSEEVNAYVSTLEFSFDAYGNAAYDLAVGDAAKAGRYVMAKTRQYIREISKNALMVEFEGMFAPMVNAPQFDISELLDLLATGYPLALGWWQRADGMYQYSLRSHGEVDVSEIARKYGGGGHAKAAGFQLRQRLSLAEPNEL